MQISSVGMLTTLRGIVRVYQGAITDLAFARSRDRQTLLASSSAAGQISASHIASLRRTHVAVHAVFCPHLEAKLRVVVKEIKSRRLRVAGTCF